ncbi:hypothetical protein Tco_0734547 [Tanacetum coccineum]
MKSEVVAVGGVKVVMEMMLHVGVVALGDNGCGGGASKTVRWWQRNGDDGGCMCGAGGRRWRHGVGRRKYSPEKFPGGDWPEFGAG